MRMTDKDVEVTLKFRNARILKAMRAKGIKSAVELARISGVHYQIVIKLVTLKNAAMRTDGEWTQAAYGISSALSVEPEDLWPNEMARVAIKTNTAKLEANLEELARVRLNADHSSLNDVYLLGKVLNAREQYVLNRRFGLCGEDETPLNVIGEQMNITGNRVMQIEAKALRKLRSHAYRKNLEFSSFA